MRNLIVLALIIAGTVMLPTVLGGYIAGAVLLIRHLLKRQRLALGFSGPR